MKAYTYWECPYCNHIMRGDKRECVNCGIPIPNNVSYLMPNDPKVIAARSFGQFHISGKIHTDENGIVSEVVDKKDERSKPNWKCDACGCQNFAEDTECKGCGATKYFSVFNKTMPVESELYYKYNKKSADEYDNNTNDEIEDTYEDNTSSSDDNEFKRNSTWCTKDDKFTENLGDESYINNKIESDSTNGNESNITVENDSIFNSFINNLKYIHEHINMKPIYITIGIVVTVLFLIWFFTPIKRTADIQGFQWTRTIEVEKYTECHESDWYLPSGAILEYTRREIHHYEQVLDHYETKTKEVPEQVLDGYDTDYIDLGNGQCDVVKTPRYKTVYHTETYQEPVYRSEPIYQTKYYYEIGRWKYDHSLTTAGSDQKPYWHETDLPKNVDNPQYGDIRQNKRTEKYIAVIIDYKNNTQKVNYNYNDWVNLKQGQTITYKTFRFSDKPL